MRIKTYKKKFIIITPIPKYDILDGIRVVLNKDFSEFSTNEMHASINKGQKVYDYPDLPKGIKIKSIFIKE